MFVAQGLRAVSKTWWMIGAVVSVVNLLIWMTVGFGWWKLIHVW